MFQGLYWEQCCHNAIEFSMRWYFSAIVVPKVLVVSDTPRYGVMKIMVGNVPCAAAVEQILGKSSLFFQRIESPWIS